MGSRAAVVAFLIVCSGGAFLFFSSKHSLGHSLGPPFSISTISSSLPPSPKWQIPPLPPQEENHIRSILSQKFLFLGEGAQAVAFQSEDGKYVLKCFKMKRFTPSLLDQLCPHVVRRRMRNLNWVFGGYLNAYRDLKEETALVWIHLAKTRGFCHAVTLIDAQGKSHQLDVDQTEFVLQEKGELIFDKLTRLRKEGKMEEVEAAITSMIALLQQRVAKGYADRDKGISHNYGFVGDRPVQLDLGRLYRGKKEREIERFCKRVEQWRAQAE